MLSHMIHGSKIECILPSVKRGLANISLFAVNKKLFEVFVFCKKGT